MFMFSYRPPEFFPRGKFLPKITIFSDFAITLLLTCLWYFVIITGDGYRQVCFCFRLFAFMTCNLCYIVSVLYYLNISFYTPFIFLAGSGGYVRLNPERGAGVALSATRRVFWPKALAAGQRAWPADLPFLTAA